MPKIDIPDDILLQSYKRFYEQRYYRFLKKSFEVQHKEPFVENWHIEYIADILQGYIERVARREKRKKHLIINIPPRSLKSFSVSIALPAWAWLINPNLKFINTSYSSLLSVEHNIKTRRLVTSDWYTKFSGIRLATDQNQKSRFENTQGGSRVATSVGGSITGGGANVIIIDDPQNPQEVASEVGIEAAIKYFDETLSTRLDNPETDIFIIVMQR